MPPVPMPAADTSASPAAAEVRPNIDAGRALVAWYDSHGRSLPWRVAAGTADPYRVWLSEVMLQQTTVAAVKPYFAAFTERWPTVEALAAADEAEVMEAWAGLGYYARARRLIASARAVAARGGFPECRAGLRELPGIGDYTSAAVAAIAFGEPVGVVDGNVERVASRLLALATPPKSARRAVEACVEAMLVRERPGDFAQAMMDLGATVCTARAPSCRLCPLAPWCAAARTDAADAYPVRQPKRPRQAWRGAAFVAVRHNGTVLLRRRPPHGLLGGMLEAFGSPWADSVPDAEAAMPFRARWSAAGTATHGLTHATLRIDVFAAAVAEDAPTPPGGMWLNPGTAGLPTLTRKIVRLGLAAAAARRADAAAPVGEAAAAPAPAPAPGKA